MSDRTQIGNAIFNLVAHLGDGANGVQALSQDLVVFVRTVTLTSAAAATAVPIVHDSEVANLPVSFEPHILWFHLDVAGATAWTDSTGTKITIEDTNGTPVEFFEISKTALLANAGVGWASSGVTLEAGFLNNAGGTDRKGLQVVADHNFAAGSDIYLTVVGYYAKQANE